MDGSYFQVPALQRRDAADLPHPLLKPPARLGTGLVWAEQELELGACSADPLAALSEDALNCESPVTRLMPFPYRLTACPAGTLLQARHNAAIQCVPAPSLCCCWARAAQSDKHRRVPGACGSSGSQR